MNRIKWTDPAYLAIVSIVGARTGLAFRPDQQKHTQEGIEAAMQRAAVSDPEQFARLLSYDVEALDHLIVELTVGETYFFREPDQFKAMRQRILPEILQRRPPGHRLRIWSAACASGEEPYSLAMLCEQEGLAKHCNILATDISSEALDKARAATYRRWSLRGELAAAAREYLLTDDDEIFRVAPRIVSLVRFEFLNLAMDVYPSAVTSTRGLDLILCRNVLIYFDRETIGEVLRRLHDCLAVDGWLITASGDPSPSEFAPFEPVVSDSGVFYRRTDATEQPSIAFPLIADLLPRPSRAQPPAAAEISRRAPRPSLPQPIVSATATLQSAETALQHGDYARASELSASLLTDPAACIVHIKALANLDSAQALQQCRSATERHPLATELHYLHAVLLMEINLDVDAAQAVQRAIFIDSSLAIAQFLLGSILQRRGSLEGARRAFRNALVLCESRPADDLLPLGEDETAGNLAQAARHHLRIIRTTLENSR